MEWSLLILGLFPTDVRLAPDAQCRLPANPPPVAANVDGQFVGALMRERPDGDRGPGLGHRRTKRKHLFDATVVIGIPVGCFPRVGISRRRLRNGGGRTEREERE